MEHIGNPMPADLYIEFKNNTLPLTHYSSYGRKSVPVDYTLY